MDEASPVNIVGASLLVMILFLFFVVTCLSSCTISFQNISTHGSATDLVDENQSTTPKVDATVTAPLSPM